MAKDSECYKWSVAKSCGNTEETRFSSNGAVVLENSLFS
jgi:hypothetical protein